MSGFYSKQAAEQLKEAFPEAVQEIREFREEITVVIDRAHMVEIATYCRDTDGLEFDMLADVGGVDYLGYPNHDGPRFGINYHIYSLEHNHMLRLKTFVPADDPTVDSVTVVWLAANWMEREIYDMFGITFNNHPDMRRILLPFDWTGHPQRKDYPLGYEEVEFSFNYDRVQTKKPHPRD